MTEPIELVHNRSDADHVSRVIEILLKQTGASNPEELHRWFESGVWFAQTCYPIIDESIPPYTPEGWTSKTELAHPIVQSFNWNPDMIRLYRSEVQKNGGHITGYNLLSEIKTNTDLIMFTGSILSFLKLQPEVIPNEWKNYNLFVTGTRHEYPGEDAYAYPCITNRYHKWISDIRRITESWGPNDVILCTK